jgi:hypothetical protein
MRKRLGFTLGFVLVAAALASVPAQGTSCVLDLCGPSGGAVALGGTEDRSAYRLDGRSSSTRSDQPGRTGAA